ncbi:hypothetical protein Tco_0757235 [Tanacetum coccineum]
MAFLIVCYDDVRRNESRSLYDRICASVELNLKDRPWNLVANHWDPDIYDRWIAYLYTELDQAKRKLMRARYKLLKWMCLGDEMGAGLGAEKRAETSGFGCWCGGENRCVWTLKRGPKWVRLGAEVAAGMRAETGGFGVCLRSLNGAEEGACGGLNGWVGADWWGRKLVCSGTLRAIGRNQLAASIAELVKNMSESHSKFPILPASEISIKDKNGDGDVYKEDDQIPSKGKCLFKALLSRRMSKKDEILYTYLDEY